MKTVDRLAVVRELEEQFLTLQEQLRTLMTQVKQLQASVSKLEAENASQAVGCDEGRRGGDAMIILLTIAAAIIGALFWADRRRYYRYRYGPVLVSDEQDLDVDGDAYCDDKVIETRKALVSELASTV